MTDIPQKVTGKKAVKGSFLLTLNNIFLKLSGLVVMVLLTSSLSLADYGFYAFVLSIHGALTAIYYFSFPSVVSADLGRYIGSGRIEEIKRLLAEHCLFQFFLGAATASLIFLFAGFSPEFIDMKTVEILPYVALMLLSTGMRNTCMIILNSHGAFSLVAWFRYLEAVLWLGTVALFIVWLNHGVRWVFTAKVISELGAFALISPLLLKQISYLSPRSMSRKWILPTIFKNHGKWALCHDIFVNVSGNFRVWIVTFFTGLEGVAIFTLARRMFAYSKTVFPLKTVLVSTFSHNIEDEDKIHDYFLRSIKYKLWLSLCIFVGGNLLVNSVVQLMFPKYFPASIPVFRILLFFVFIKVFTEVFGAMFNALQAQKYLFYTFCGSMISLALFCPLFTFMWGERGSALEIILSGVVGSFLGYRLLIRKQPSLIIEWRKVLCVDGKDRRYLREIFDRFGIRGH